MVPLLVMSLLCIFVHPHVCHALNPSNDFHPTQDEISRGFVHAAPIAWGVRVRLENSLRLMTLGGSNTAVGSNGQYYVDRLRDVIVRWSKQGLIGVDSYVMNEGIVGTGPTRKQYFFDRELPSKWPNIISLEFAVNVPNSWQYALDLDDLIFFINSKYAAQNLPYPAYFLIELFRIDHLYPDTTKLLWQDAPHTSPKPRLDSSGMSRLNSDSVDLDYSASSFNRGSMGGAVLDALARFYGYPLLSMTDALYPSFVRYYSTYSNETMWPYSKDGLHLSHLGGDLLVNQLILPFLQRELKHRETDVLYQNVTSIYNFDLRMFPKNKYSGGFVQRWASWGGGINTLESQVVTLEGEVSAFSFRSSLHHEDGSHICYGSTKRGAVARLGFNLHPSLMGNQQTESPYKLRVGFLFSWNMSYVGQVSCGLFITEANEYTKKISQIGSTVHLDLSVFKGNKVRDTTLREVSEFA